MLKLVHEWAVANEWTNLSMKTENVLEIIAGQVENWAKEFISAKWDRPVQSKITIFTQKNIVFYNG